MGFSVSGAAALIFAALLIGVGMFHAAATNGFEAVSDAQQDRTDRALEQQNSGIEIATASYDTAASDLTVVVNNTGAATARLSETDVLLDGSYETGWAGNATVDGDGDTDLWHGGEQLRIEWLNVSQPGRVKVVAGTGVADTAEVTTV